MNISFNQSLLRYILYPFLKLLLHIKFIGADNLPTKQPFILASNHVSLIDPFLLATLDKRNFRRVVGTRFLTSSLYYDNTVLRVFLRPLGILRVAPIIWDFSSYFKETLDALRSAPVLIFIEGKRTKSLTTAKPGVGYLASNTGLPVVPVHIKFVSRRSIILSFGVPKKYTGSDYQIIADEIYRSIQRLG